MTVNAMAGMQAAGEKISGYNVAATETDQKTAVDAGSKVQADATGASTDAVYEKGTQESAKAPYSINKMSKEDRAALVKQLKADQAGTYGIAQGDDSIWKIFADGNFTVDEAAKAQAQEDISEDGYWGVKQTSQRLFDFASALAGDDVDKMQEMQRAMEKGYNQATGAWGKELPDISSKTMEAANKLFEDYYKSKESE